MEFSIKFIGLSVLMALLVTPSIGLSNQVFEQHSYSSQASYKRLAIPIKSQAHEDGTQVIEVRIFYGYDCRGCSALHNFFMSWEASAPLSVAVHRTPVSTANDDRMLELFAKVESTSVAQALHQSVFESGNNSQPVWRNSRSQSQLFRAFGIDYEPQSVGSETQKEPQVSSTNLFETLKIYKAQQKIYRIEQLPAIIINGTYLLDGAILSNSEQLQKTLDYLVEKEHMKLF